MCSIVLSPIITHCTVLPPQICGMSIQWTIVLCQVFGIQGQREHKVASAWCYKRGELRFSVHRLLRLPCVQLQLLCSVVRPQERRVCRRNHSVYNRRNGLLCENHLQLHTHPATARANNGTNCCTNTAGCASNTPANSVVRRNRGTTAAHADDHYNSRSVCTSYCCVRG